MTRRRKHRISPATVDADATGPVNRWAAWLTGHQKLALALLLALFCAAAALSFDPKPFVGGDNATYVLLSRSLAQGQGMTEFWTPEARPATLYPFGFPLLLSPIAFLRLSYPWYKAVPLLAALAALWLLWLLLRERGIGLAAATVLLCAVNPTFVEYSHWVLSELPFLACSLLSLYLLRRWERDGAWLALAGTIAAAVFTYHIRSSGVALYLGIAVYLLLRRRFMAAAVFLAGCLLLSIPWALRTRAVGSGMGYLDWLLVRNPYQLELGRVSLAELLQRLWHNALHYGGAILPRLVLPAIDAWNLALPGWLWFAMLTLPMIGSLAFRLVTTPDAVSWYVTAYLGSALLWPEVWTDVRFVLPVAPFLIYYTIIGYRAAFTALRVRVVPVATMLLVAVLAVTGLVAMMPAWPGALDSQIGYWRGDLLAGYPPEWRSFFDAAQWVGNHSAPQAVVVSRKPPLFSLTSGRHSYCYPFTANADSVRAAVLRADYVMVEPIFSGTAQRYLIPAIGPLVNKRLFVVYQEGNPPTYVLHVNKEDHDAKGK